MLMRVVSKTLRTTLLTAIRPPATNSRSIKRWVSPTLKELYRRQQKIGPVKPDPRSSYLEWNYDAELFAFGKRLREDFDQVLLKQAFTQPSYKHESTAENVGNNKELVAKGDALIFSYLNEYFSKLPNDVGEALRDYLMSEKMLAHVSKHLGVQELIQSGSYPPSQQSFSDTLKALVGILDSDKVPNFIRDFLVSQLIEKDICDIWEPSEPYNYLVNLLKTKGLSDIEPRLCNESASSTILANYRVGLYSNKKLLGLGWGESVKIAKQTAALNAIRKIYNFKCIELV